MHASATAHRAQGRPSAPRLGSDWDLLLVAALAILCGAVASLVDLAAPRVVAGLALELVLPGYALNALARPRMRLDGAQLLLGTLGASLAVSAVGGLALDVLPGHMGRIPWATMLTVVTVGAAAAARTWPPRRLQEYSDAPPPQQPPPERGSRRGRLPAECGLGALALLTAAAAVAIAAGAADRTPGFAELSTLPSSSAAQPGMLIAVKKPRTSCRRVHSHDRRRRAGRLDGAPEPAPGSGMASAHPAPARLHAPAAGGAPPGRKPAALPEHHLLSAAGAGARPHRDRCEEPSIVSGARPGGPPAIVPRLLAARLLRSGAGVVRGERAARAASPPGLSVVMAAHDERETIEGCLAQLAGLADEIVVVDAQSSDGTAEVAARFADRVIHTTNKPMLEINKNIAMEAATRRWVLVLDPDERITPALREQIRAVVDGEDQRIAAYWMPRRNYILGRWIRTMGMYPGSQLRLVRRGEGRFSEQEHHLPMAVEGPVGYLTGDLVHLSDARVSEILAKRTRYAEFAAAQMYAAGVPFRASRLLIDPARSFLTQYVLLGGWLEGVRGLLYAGLSAYGALLRHARLRELHGGS